MDIKSKLICAVTEHVLRMEKRKCHNPYALAHYLRAVNEVMEDIEAGMSPKLAVANRFCDRLETACQKAIK